MREERAGAGRVRLAVVGSAHVGKSALIVRYLTRRYIGEYRSNTDLLYRQTVMVGGAPTELEVIDVSTPHTPTEQVEWADAVVLVYAVTDRRSYVHARDVLLRTARPTALLANKTDLDHLRQVSTAEGAALATEGGATFAEVSVADNSPALYSALDTLLTAASANNNNTTNNTRYRKFSVTKMLGSLIGSSSGGRSEVAGRGGSVVACPPPHALTAAP